MRSVVGTFLFALIVSAIPNPIFSRQQKAGCDTLVHLNASSNIWKDYTLHVNSIYRGLVAAAIPRLPQDKNLRYKAELIRDKAGTFVWIEGPGQISRIDETVKDVPCNAILGLVISGLPWKKCPGMGFPPVQEPYDYAKEYIDPIVKIIKAHPNTAFALVIEPGTLGTVVRNANDGTCKHVHSSYHRNVPYALKALNLPNVVMYLDAEHGGVLGWKDIVQSAGQEIVKIWTNAGKPTQFRGLAVNIKGYNSWNLTPGERFEDEIPTCADLINRARNEKQYLALLERELIKSNTPAFGIIDISRGGQFGIREYWTDWCNVDGAGPGLLPTARPDTIKIDAFIWAKWIGESDGTSDPSSLNFQAGCANRTSFIPMPEKGEWSQEYFEMALNKWKITAPNGGKRSDEGKMEEREAVFSEIDENILKRCG